MYTDTFLSPLIHICSHIGNRVCLLLLQQPRTHTLVSSLMQVWQHVVYYSIRYIVLYNGNASNREVYHGQE